MINYKEITPKEKHLLPYIQSYTYSIGTLNERGAKHIIRAFPTFMTQIFFEFFGGLSEIENDGKRVEVTKRTYISCGLGSWMDIFQIESEQKTRSVKNFKVELYPHTLYEVFGISPTEVMNNDLDIEDIFGKTKASILYEELESCDDGNRMIKIFEKYFTNMLLINPVRKKNITAYFPKNISSLKLLSENIGYSQRWIQKQYLEILGISFKKIQNNKRFLYTINYINNKVLGGEKNINFTHIAYECNYYDQAHFIREFKKNTGITPGVYLSQRYQNSVGFFW